MENIMKSKDGSKWLTVGKVLILGVLMALISVIPAFAVDPSPSPCTGLTSTTSSDAIGTIYTMYAWEMVDNHPDPDLWDPREIGVDSGVLWDYFPAAESSGTGVFDTYMDLKSTGNNWDEQG